MISPPDVLLDRLIPQQEQKDFKDFIFILFAEDRGYLLRNDILLKFREVFGDRGAAFLTGSGMARFLDRVPEMFIIEEALFVLHRHAIARYRFYQTNRHCEFMEEITVADYLKHKDRHVMGKDAWRRQAPLVIDFLPFHDYAPAMRDSRNIGNGIRFLNKHLSSSLFQDPEKWGRKLYDFIKLHKINGKPLLVNGNILDTVPEFLEELEKTIDWLSGRPPDTPYHAFEGRLKKQGFEEGWGLDAARARETMSFVYNLFSEPDSDLLERFISRIPMISKIAIISPHGWFGQENVLGRPDTGGQVIYILDQVRALEAYAIRRFHLAGIQVMPKIIVLTRLIPEADGTTCDHRTEKIRGTRNAWILRLPFRDADMKTVPHWISRFHIWPYLDRFAYDARRELVSEFEGRPDLIIGNYADGNLVASLLSDRLDVIQCTIAHALEKTKYLFSDLYWERMEEDYHFSLQFTADMLAMNKSDFIITSTYQEIAGTETTVGQYESYQFFTLPGLYQAAAGVNLFNPKFNIVPPGVDENNYFPYGERDRRAQNKSAHWAKRLFTDRSDDIVGRLENPDLPPIFTMARLDKIKNITGLIEAFGGHPKLREHANLILVAGTTRIEESHDREEQEQIEKAHGLIAGLNLHGRVRWLPSVEKSETGEVYRLIADRRGVFVQPALFEAFGLTILEAMLSGLPTFGPIFGGPSEIIEDGDSGFLMNTSKPALIADTVWKFFDTCRTDDAYWTTISEAGIRRVREHFTWELYSEKLITLTKLYGFWRYSVAEQGMVKMDRYCDLIYHLLLKNRAEEEPKG